MKIHHKEIYALIDSDRNEGIVVMETAAGPGEERVPMPCVALKRLNADMFTLLAKRAKEDLPKGKSLMLVRFTNPEVLDVIEGPPVH